ncbi:PD-(D/E)XK nuclease family protein [Cylindrospermum sp. FACHB-282]|uniref:PD-(D/E)XK nuclease family protein n=1 Tax=Cylindrospermum sp. FACHB-282 TaxID=2692794 RepID=UPI0016882FA8|nr:PD-(D/E)XK nuclease family protein [Cylindrospermum sp. FACHB-282]MBD2386188.1 PD-(D/E)XK nuclease family protein [Cylindrospermum sp. FACHB-282]
MLSTYTKLLRLSQGQLNLLEACPRKFQHTYLEQLNTPSNPQQEEKQTLGSRFHLLMQQQEMGLPIQSFLEADAQLQSWMAGFANAAPEILTPFIDNQTFRESEHYRTLQVQNYLLTVIYDLLIADRQQAQILDWKTYPQPPTRSKLEKNWQTRLYMFVLAETSEYSPEQISMTYWFVQSQGQPQSIKFSYDASQHKKTAKRLNQLLSQLSNWLELYQKDELFPQVPEAQKALCNNCQFAVRCARSQRGVRGASRREAHRSQVTEEAIANSLPNLDNIQEIAL